MQTYAAPKEIAVPGFLDAEGRFDLAAYDKASDEYRERLAEYAKSFGSHTLAGATVRTPFADGYAEYTIAKVNGKVSLIHVPLGDAWRDGRFERTVTVAELTNMVARAKRRAAAFA